MNPSGRYLKGQKWCRTCQAWKNYEGLFCQDCGYRMRTVPARKKFRNKVKVFVRY